MLMIALLLIVAFGLSTLSSLELRRASREIHFAQARANARLAMMQAIGQLQREMGPDRRVSAPAALFGDDIPQPHWTGVWRTRREDGGSHWVRDDLSGGLRSRRPDDREDGLIGWLASGDADPREPFAGETALLVGEGTAGDGDRARVEAPKIGLVDAGGDATGHLAWWTGDLGIRANLRPADPHGGGEGPEAESKSSFYAVMASQQADAEIILGAERFAAGERAKLASAGMVAAVATDEDWRKDRWFDYTVDSLGVLADVDAGGLKRDLTAFFASDGSIPDKAGLRGIDDTDPLVGADPDDGLVAGETRHFNAAPRFGLLRDWARSAVAFSGNNVGAVMPETDRSAGGSSPALALANETPVKLAGNLKSALQPVLVEATNYIHISSFLLANAGNRYQLRHHLYPRVVLWNPYNVELKSEGMIVMIQGNGRQEMWTENEHLDSQGRVIFRSTSQWLSFEGGRSTSFNASGMGIMGTEGYNDPYIGSYYFSIPPTRFGPGECLVFSPARSAEYDCLSPYRPGSYNLAANELSCEVQPDPSRSYYVSGTDIGGGISYRPVRFWYAPTPYWSLGGRNGVENQGDDTRAVLKALPAGGGSVSFEDFDALPQICVLSASLQYGAGREPRIAWNQYERMPIELLDRQAPRATVVPNVRTREGLRLRWFREHPSNLIGSGGLNGTPHFEEALLANWNPRAAFIIRSPWDNIGGTLPVTGGGGGPWFFGAYTRDLFDQAVSWDDQTPVPRDGRFHGNPFGPPQEGPGRIVLFDVPRSETGVVSLGQLQHVKLTDFIWHPSFAIGNSLADPRLGEGGNSGLARTAAVSPSPAEARLGGFHQDAIGWSGDSQRSTSRSEWAATARAILGGVPESDNVVYDLSYEANRTLWDAYHLSGATEEALRRFVSNPATHPLPNGRLRLSPLSYGVSADSLADFHESAAHLMTDGAFNVNSTRVEAWKALLASTRGSGYSRKDGTPFPRVLHPPGGPWTAADSAAGDDAWCGYRVLTDEEIGRLAEAIVGEVKLRGPFLSLADFVNRRLAEDETGRSGALQAAIDKAGINRAFAEAHPLDNRASLPDYDHPDHIRDATRLEQTLKPDTKAWGIPGHLTQADVLQVLGPALSARSDTFVIRAYGDSVDAGGDVQAAVWCEAVVQRVPRPLYPDSSGINPRDAGKPGDFGRAFILASFRWLAPGEI